MEEELEPDQPRASCSWKLLTLPCQFLLALASDSRSYSRWLGKDIHDDNHDHGRPMTPTLANGKICYVEMSATDVHRSAEFYEKVFGWQIRQRGNGSIAFDDGVGEVSGTWVTGRTAATPGLLIYIIVDSVAATIDTLTAHGGELVQPIGADAPEITARFRDPAGNVIGLYQQPKP